MFNQFTKALLLLFAVVSPTFAQQDYGEAVHLSTYFLGAQRSGDNQSWIHGASHTQDGQTLNPSADLTGGWHDCGDHVKFNFTNNWAATNYLFGYHLFSWGYPDNYSEAYSAPPSNGIPDILDECRNQIDYTKRCYNNGVVVKQVGSGDYDHNGSFAEPATQSALPANKGGDPRPIYTTTACPNILGSASASLSIAYLTYKDHDLVFANQCLQTAKDYYSLGVGKTGSCGSTDCSSGGNACYDLSSKSHEDEMCMAAAMLYEATGEAAYLTAAENYYDANIWDGEVHYYGNMYMLSAAELYILTGKVQYLNDLKDHFDYHKAAKFSTLGFYKYQYSGGWGNLQYTGNEAFLAAILDAITPGGNSEAYTFAKSNVDFILGGHNGLGNIPANYSFLIGYNEMGGGYPQRPHHKSAFGSTVTNWSKFTSESNTPGSTTYAYELKGALVGGPDDSGNYSDVIDNFQNSEVCTYYNAGFLGAAAYVNGVENSLITSSNTIKKQQVKVFPTITQGVVFVNSDQFIGFAQVFDTRGKLVKSVTASNITQVSLQGLKKGVYFIKFNEMNYIEEVILK